MNQERHGSNKKNALDRKLDNLPIKSRSVQANENIFDRINIQFFLLLEMRDHLNICASAALCQATGRCLAALCMPLSMSKSMSVYV